MEEWIDSNFLWNSIVAIVLILNNIRRVVGVGHTTYP
jgi:hypothetical protein